MKYRIVLSPGAKADLRSAARWYLNIDPNLAFRFLVEVKTTLLRITRMPYSFPIRRSAFRQAPLKRFPYSIFYLVNIGSVGVEAIVHQRRSDPPG
jgi:plasmid stabilization system protein ParE